MASFITIFPFLFVFPFILFAASVLKAVLRYGKKQYMVDETRRDSYYNNPVASGNEPPVLATVDGEFKQLIAVRTYAIFLFILPQ